MKTSIFVFGQTGRMGEEVLKRIAADENLSFIGGYSRSNPQIELEHSPDLVIDFSLPASLPELVAFAKKYNVPVVSGTTGYSDAEKKQLKELGSQIPVFWAANMSFGVYLMCQLTEMLARYERFYEYRIEETHHIHKKDKPSGTALIIEEAARKSTEKLKPTLSHREGEVFGIHSFFANSNDETLEIKHEAKNRGLFAQGALDVGKWLIDQKPGFYNMDDFFQTFKS